MNKKTQNKQHKSEFLAAEKPQTSNHNRKVECCKEKVRTTSENAESRTWNTKKFNLFLESLQKLVF